MRIELRSELRSATHDQHIKVNRHPLIEGLTKAGFPQRNYLALLRSYAPLYQALEAEFETCAESMKIPFSYSDRKKLPMIMQDLRYYNASPFESLSMQVPEIKSLGALVGVLYAIEGSTLGGQVISRSLEQHLGVNKESGAAFFNGYGDATKEKWVTFIQFAEAAVTNDQELAEAKRAARETFTLFDGALNSAQEFLQSGTHA